MKWIRLWTDEVLKGTTFTELNLAERGFWWSLLLLAGDSLNPGIVELRKNVAHTPSTLAFMLNIDPRTVRKCTDKLVSVGKIVILNDGRIQICNWQKYQTRYEKYYKNNNKDYEEEIKKDTKNNGISMPGRLEEEKKKSKKCILSELLFDLIKERSNNFKQPNFKIWNKHIDLMIRIDKRDPKEIKQIIIWCQANTFWQNNILSTAKLRKQYDQLALKKGENENRYT